MVINVVKEREADHDKEAGATDGVENLTSALSVRLLNVHPSATSAVFVSSRPVHLFAGRSKESIGPGTGFATLPVSEVNAFPLNVYCVILSPINNWVMPS